MRRTVGMYPTYHTQRCVGIFFANVPRHLSLLAFGIPPAREAELAGGMPKVLKGQGLGGRARWAIFFCKFLDLL